MGRRVARAPPVWSQTQQTARNVKAATTEVPVGLVIFELNRGGNDQVVAAAEPRELAEACGKLTKGDPLFVVGRLTTRWGASRQENRTLLPSFSMNSTPGRVSGPFTSSGGGTLAPTIVSLSVMTVVRSVAHVGEPVLRGAAEFVPARCETGVEVDAD